MSSSKWTFCCTYLWALFFSGYFVKPQVEGSSRRILRLAEASSKKVFRNNDKIVPKNVLRQFTEETSSESFDPSITRRTTADLSIIANQTSFSPDFSHNIVGGTDIQKDVYPWFTILAEQECINLSYQNDCVVDTISTGCGGSLISPHYVLTAAHCVFGQSATSPLQKSVIIGALCPFGNPDNCGQKKIIREVNEILIHPKYDDITYNFDFALLRLKGPDITEIEPVLLDTKDRLASATDTTIEKVLGFGFLTTFGPLPETVQVASVAYVPPEQCQDAYQDQKLAVDITESKTCAFIPGVADACFGDSGGPLLYQDVQVGLVSFGGAKCADEKLPGIYAKVSAGLPWIRSQICGKEKASFCKSEKSCTDSADAKFSTSAGEKRRCAWLQKNAKRQAKYCTDKYDAISVCPMTCQSCSH